MRGGSGCATSRLGDGPCFLVKQSVGPIVSFGTVYFPALGRPADCCPHLGGLKGQLWKAGEAAKNEEHLVD